jgi:hypothetical protein
MDQLVSEPGRNVAGLRCRPVGGQPFLVHQILDARKNKTVRVVCECGERIRDG